MKRKSVRLIAITLTLSLVLPLFTGCKKRVRETVSDEDPWYNASTVVIGSEIDKADYEYINLIYVGMDDDDFVFRVTGSLKTPSDYSGDDYKQYWVDELRVYDMSGALETVIDYSDLTSHIPDCDEGYISDITTDDQYYYVNVTGYSYNSSANRNFVSKVDLDTGTVGPLEELTAGNAEYALRLQAQGANRETPITVGAYTIEKFYFYGGDSSSYVLEVLDENNAPHEFDMRLLFPHLNIMDVTSAFDLGHDRALIVASVSGGYSFFLLDLQNMTIAEEKSQMEWLAAGMDRVVQVKGMGTLISNSDGIVRVNYESRCLEPVFLYTYTNINSYEVKSFTPCYITYDRAVFSGTRYDPINSGDSQTVMYVFDRAETNPNAGKAYLSIASVTDYSYALCDAICTFNANSSEYFLRIDNSYNIFNASMMSSNSDNSSSGESIETELGNRLAIDIMSGTGPDIIVNGEQFGMLNNDDYLVNMSDYVSEHFGSDMYFTNIFDAARDGDELFQIPVSVNAVGIVTAGSNVEPGQTGFTFDQYEAFIEGPCNGSNPIDSGRLSFFIQSLNCMTDLVYDGNRVNYNSEAFRALAEYTEANINEVLQVDDGSQEEEPIYGVQAPAEVVRVDCLSTYFNKVRNGNSVMLGLPSYDGRGPVIVSSDSVAISAQTEAVAACEEFVNIVLAEQAQEWYGLSSGIPLNREAFEEVGDRYIAVRNRNLEYMLDQGFTEADLRMLGYNPLPMDESSVGEFETFVEGLTGWYTNDGVINGIIGEEMPAYFAGQKTLDQVIAILEDRVQTLLNERG